MTLVVGRRILVAASLALVLAACATRQAPPTADPAATMVADRLFLGREIPDGGAVSDGEWAAFLEEFVTPRFPEGLTVWRAEGQWLDPRGATVREPVMVIEVLHPGGDQADIALAEIAEEYRQRFHQDAVLRVTTDARVQLIE